MRNIVVVFTENNARIITEPEDLSIYSSMPNALINPDLSSVVRVPPHLWKIDNGKIAPIEGKAKVTREDHIESYGAVNDVFSQILLAPVKQSFYSKHKQLIKTITIKLLEVAVISTVAILIERYLHG